MPEEHTFAQCNENEPTVSKIDRGGSGTIPWVDCIGVVRITHNLVRLTQIVSWKLLETSFVSSLEYINKVLYITILLAIYILLCNAGAYLILR